MPLNKIEEFQQHLNEICKGQVKRKGTGFQITYGRSNQTALMADDIQSLKDESYTYQIEGKKQNRIFVEIYASKFPA